MENTTPKHTYIFQDPNRPAVLIRTVKQILLEKLLSLPMKTPAGG